MHTDIDTDGCVCEAADRFSLTLHGLPPIPCTIASEVFLHTYVAGQCPTARLLLWFNQFAPFFHSGTVPAPRSIAVCFQEPHLRIDWRVGGTDGYQGYGIHLEYDAHILTKRVARRLLDLFDTSTERPFLSQIPDFVTCAVVGGGPCFRNDRGELEQLS